MCLFSSPVFAPCYSYSGTQVWKFRSLIWVKNTGSCVISRKDNQFKKEPQKSAHCMKYTQLNQKKIQKQSAKILVFFSLRYILIFLSYSLSWELFLLPKSLWKLCFLLKYSCWVIWAIRMPWHIRQGSIVHFLYRWKYRLCSSREWPKSSASWEAHCSRKEPKLWKSTTFYIYFRNKENNNMNKTFVHPAFCSLRQGEDPPVWDGM